MCSSFSLAVTLRCFGISFHLGKIVAIRRRWLNVGLLSMLLVLVLLWSGGIFGWGTVWTMVATLVSGPVMGAITWLVSKKAKKALNRLRLKQPTLATFIDWLCEAAKGLADSVATTSVLAILVAAFFGVSLVVGRVVAPPESDSFKVQISRNVKDIPGDPMDAGECRFIWSTPWPSARAVFHAAGYQDLLAGYRPWLLKRLRAKDFRPKPCIVVALSDAILSQVTPDDWRLQITVKDPQGDEVDHWAIPGYLGSPVFVGGSVDDLHLLQPDKEWTDDLKQHCAKESLSRLHSSNPDTRDPPLSLRPDMTVDVALLLEASLPKPIIKATASWKVPQPTKKSDAVHALVL